MADFATRLRELRKERNLRQIDLATDLGVAQTTIANYEQHSRFPDEETLHSIANYFDISLDYLMGREDTRNGYPRYTRRRRGDVPEREPLSPLATEYLDLLLSGKKDQAYQRILKAVRDGAASAV